MLNTRKYTALAVLGVGLAVAAATPVPAKAYWFGWGGPSYGYAGFHRFGYGCGCPRAYGASTLRVCGVLPAPPILSTLRVRRLHPAISILSAVLRLRRIQADVSVLSTGLRLWGVLSEVPILSGCALLVVGRPHSKTADWPHKRQATSAVTATALV